MSSSSTTSMSITTGPAVVSAEFHVASNSTTSSRSSMDDRSTHSSVHTMNTTITSTSMSTSISNNESMIAMLRETTIFLNNTAVSLLGTYHNYVAAIQTMKDALELLSKSINMSSTASGSNNNSQQPQQQPTTLASLYDLHQRVISNASHRLQIESQNVGTDQEQRISPEPYSSSSLPLSLTTSSTEETPKMNEIGVVVLPCNFNPNEAYHLLATIRTSKVALRIVTNDEDPTMNHNNNNDYYRNLHVVRSILVYNYGIAHRCCTPAPTPAVLSNQQHSNHATIQQHPRNNNHNNNNNNNNGNKVGTFCLQIFQYAEQLLIPALENNNHIQQDEQPPQELELLGLSSSSNNNNSSNYLLLYRFLLTRNLMMISCKMGMLLCELYKQTLDPIESEILLLPQQSSSPSSSSSRIPSQQQLQLQSEQQQQSQQERNHSSNNTVTNDTQMNASAA